jgi:hypothetical protein
VIEDFHVARTIVAFRNVSLEASVGQRVIFHFHGQPLLADAKRRTFGTAQLFSTPSISRRKS